jgi:hypothetical protein
MKLAHPYRAGKLLAYTPRRAEELTAEVLRKTLALWQVSAAGTSPPPAASDFDIVDYRQVVACINLIEVREPPLDFVFRVYAQVATDCTGQDMTGRSGWDFPDPGYGGFLREVCRRATRERRAQVIIEDVLVWRPQTRYDCPCRWEALVLPLSGPPGVPGAPPGGRSDGPGDAAVTRLVFAFDLQPLP